MNWDKVISFILASFGAIGSYLFGGWHPLLTFLLVAVVLDYFTGIAAGYVEGQLSSKIGFKNIPKKIMIFVFVTIGHLIDTTLGDSHVFRDATIVFYLCNELLSITENAGRMGVPVPEQLQQAIQVLKGKGEGK
jgi:toxin secretion/phage lysis holin